MEDRGPSPHRMNRHAIAVLEDAELRSTVAPIAPEAASRLALSWLVLNRIANLDQVADFWKLLTKPPDNPEQPQAEYCRVRDMRILINAWRRNAGMKRI